MKDLASEKQREALEKMKRSEGLAKEPIDVHVEVENRTLQQTLKLREELEEKAKKLEGVEQMFERVKEKLVQRLNEEGIEIEPDQIQDVDDLTAFSGVLNELRERSTEPRTSASGTVPLSGQTASSESGFDSYHAMIDHLVGLESKKGLPSREAQKILNEFWKRSQRAIGETKRPIEIKIPSDEELLQGKGLRDILNQRYRNRHGRKEDD